MRIESTSESLADTDTGQNIDVSFDTDFESQNGLDPVSIETVSRISILSNLANYIAFIHEMTLPPTGN